MAIRVRNLQTGQTGTLVDERAFDPQKYEVIQPEQKSVGGFVKNVGTDLGENIKGIASLPKLLQQLVTSPVQTTKAVAKGVGGEYKDLLQQPGQTAYDKPISTILNILPFLQAGKIATAGKAGKVAKAGELGKAADIAKGVTTIAQHTKKAGAATKFIQGVGESAAARVTKATPSAFDNAASYGMDLNAVLAKYTPKKGAVLEDFVGDISSRGKGGIIANEISNAEKVIQNRISKSGNKIVASTDDIVSPLNDIKSKISRLPGEGEKIANLDDFINSTRELYPDGFTAKELLDLKRAFDERFGKSIIEEGKGAVNAQAQKVITNKARELLKKEFPDIKKALDTESELYTLRPVLNRARAIDKTQGSTIRRGSLAAVDLTKPGSIVDLVTENPRVSTLLSKLQNFEGPKMPDTLAKILQTGKNAELLKATPLKIGATSAVGRNVPQQAVEGTPTQEIPTPTPTVPTEPTELANTAGFPKITPEKLMMARLSLSDKAYKVVEDIYKIQQGEGAGGKPLSSATENRVQLANSGLRALNQLEKAYEKDPSKVLKAAIPGSLGARDYEAMAFKAVEGLLRSRSGAAVPETEVKRYMKANLPRLGDSPETIALKFASFRKDLEEVANSGSTTPNPVDVLQNAGINLQ